MAQIHGMRDGKGAILNSTEIKEMIIRLGNVPQARHKNVSGCVAAIMDDRGTNAGGTKYKQKDVVHCSEGSGQHNSTLSVFWAVMDNGAAKIVGIGNHHYADNRTEYDLLYYVKEWNKHSTSFKFYT